MRVAGPVLAGRPGTGGLRMEDTMEAIGPLDHVIILVRDLDRALAQMTRLGFRPTQRALHSAAMGTANSTVMFGDDTYVELLTVVRETPLSAHLKEMLDRREGPAGIAMKTSDGRAAAHAFAAAGIAAGDATDFSRPVDLPGGTREAAFTVARLAPAATPGAWMFVCQHHTPEVVWREDHIEQPNGVAGIAEVIGIAAALEPVEAAYERVFGRARVTRTADGLEIAAGSARLSFLQPLAFAARFGRMPRRREAHLKALVLRADALTRVARVLDEQGTRYAETAAGTLLVPPEAASGTLLEFIEADPPG